MYFQLHIYILIMSLPDEEHVQIVFISKVSLSVFADYLVQPWHHFQGFHSGLSMIGRWLQKPQRNVSTCKWFRWFCDSNHTWLTAGWLLVLTIFLDRGGEIWGGEDGLWNGWLRSEERSQSSSSLLSCEGIGSGSKGQQGGLFSSEERR